MSEGQSTSYKLEIGLGVKEQIEAIKSKSKQMSKLLQFIHILEEAVHRLRTDPFGWGDPEYRSKTVDAVVCHGIIRPISFRFTIYEQVRVVVLLSVDLYADFA